MFRIILGALALLGASAQAAAPQPVAEKMAALLQPHELDPYLNGGVLVAEDGKPVFQRSAGLADFEARKPNEADSVFQTASASKPFTSTAVLQLRDRGRLRLDDAVAAHMPGFPYPGITVRHLLSHTSGLPDLELYEPVIAAEPDKVIRGADLIPALKAWDKPLPFKPGERFRYSNTNYFLLAQIVERVSGKPFGQFLRDSIFRPAGMRSTYVLGTRPLGEYRDPVRKHVFAVMYQTVPRDVATLDLKDKVRMRPFRYEGYNLGSTVGDQNVFTTLGDLMRFDRALTSGKLLRKASQEEAYAPVRLNDGSAYIEPQVYEIYGARCSYGLGWEVCDHPTRGRLVGHVGYSRGIATIFYRNLDKDRVIAMYDNGDTGDFGPKVASFANLLNGDEPLKVSRTKSLTREYGRALIEEGPAAALILYNRLRGEPERWAGTQAGMNRLGYDLLFNGYEALALEPFRINVLLHPDDFNAYDSYGEALAANGMKAEAILAYRRSLELNPESEGGKAALQKLTGETP